MRSREGRWGLKTRCSGVPCAWLDNSNPLLTGLACHATLCMQDFRRYLGVAPGDAQAKLLLQVRSMSVSAPCLCASLAVLGFALT